MSIDTLKSHLPDYAKDLKLNLGSVLTPEGAPGLSENQIHGIALASAVAARHPETLREIAGVVREHTDEATFKAAQAAAAIMGMNNIYYRSLHLMSDQEYLSMPAKLRMNVIGRPGVEKADFELYSLAVSAVNGCGMCLDAHEKELRKHGLGREAVQSALRIASVIHAVAVTLESEAALAGETV